MIDPCLESLTVVMVGVHFLFFVQSTDIFCSISSCFIKKEKNRHLNLFTSKQLNLLMRKNPAIETKLLASTNRIYEKHLQ